MKFSFIVTCLLMLIGCSAQSKVDENTSAKPLNIEHQSVINKSQWRHGSADCDTNKDPAVEVYQDSSNSYILRQNKCLTFEAPFIYILVGKQTILVLDTGALDSKEFSLYITLEDILGKKVLANKEMLVAHTHGHGDHYQGDASFEGRANVTLIQPSQQNINQFFGFDHWPNGEKTIDLGDRKITVIPTPGHQEQAISIYDHQSKWLFTGDTLYPGYIYVKDWDAYRKSIHKLTTFASNNEVTAIFGAHIEMKSKPASYYPIGTTYQPNEATLDLGIQDLRLLNEKLIKLEDPQELIFDHFFIKPMSSLQRILSNVAGWFTL